jgi:hypothetical protein
MREIIICQFAATKKPIQLDAGFFYNQLNFNDYLAGFCYEAAKLYIKRCRNHQFGLNSFRKNFHKKRNNCQQLHVAQHGFVARLNCL